MKRNLIIDTIIDGGLIPPASVVIVGVSGGPDSLCLLHALSSIADMYDLVIEPVHVNHMLRPEAAEECEHLEDICFRMDLDLRVYEASCSDLAEELGVSVEEAGRQMRYEIFDEVASEFEEEAPKPEAEAEAKPAEAGPAKRVYRRKRKSAAESATDPVETKKE